MEDLERGERTGPFLGLPAEWASLLCRRRRSLRTPQPHTSSRNAIDLSPSGEGMRAECALEGLFFGI